MHTYNISHNIYPLQSATHSLYFETKPGTDVLGLFFADSTGFILAPIGHYSVEKAIWHSRNDALDITEDQLAEVLALAKAYHLARAVRFSKLKTLANSDIYRQ